jgi:hypothetical protein
MEFKTKAALAEWASDQTMAEIAAYYNGLPSVKPLILGDRRALSYSFYSVFRNAMSARLSSSVRFSPNSCPLMARVCTA